jgi:hypothetical protein
MGDMESLHWLIENWFEVLGTIGVVGGLFFNGYSLRSETKTRKVANLLTLTQSHREIWKEMLRKPGLQRVLDVNVNPAKEPVTQSEEIFVTLVIQHLTMMLHAMHDELTIQPEGLRQDVRQFFRLPIPRTVWEKSKAIQDQELVRFVEDSRK